MLSQLRGQNHTSPNPLDAGSAPEIFFARENPVDVLQLLACNHRLRRKEGMTMSRKEFTMAFCSLACAAFSMVMMFWEPPQAEAGLTGYTSGYQVLAPITEGNLTIFPVVAASSHDTSEFLTLDEALRSGEVEVMEAGQVQGLIRRGGRPYHSDGAQVNQLVLVNHSKRPLLLLAGEIVTGGKQDRIVGKDRIIPAESDADLGVFCVEPGRWTGASMKFGTTGAYGGDANNFFYMAQPSVRAQAMDKKDQQKVWDEVNKSRAAMAAGVPAPAAAEVNGVTSYAKVMENTEVARQVDAVAAPIQHSYQSVIHELRQRNAVGVVVAVNGRIIWADVFASTSLLEKYWPKLVRSYAAEAVEQAHWHGSVSMHAAQDFLSQLGGTHEVADSEPGIYRQSEISGDGYKVFELTSLLPNTGFELHISKMAEA